MKIQCDIGYPKRCCLTEQPGFEHPTERIDARAPLTNYWKQLSRATSLHWKPNAIIMNKALRSWINEEAIMVGDNI